MHPKNSAAAKARQEVSGAIRERCQQNRAPQNGERFSGSSWKPPKCKVQGETAKGDMTGMGNAPADKMDTTAASGNSMPELPRYNHDRLPSLDDEPDGGLRWVIQISPMH